MYVKSSLVFVSFDFGEVGSRAVGSEFGLAEMQSSAKNRKNKLKQSNVRGQSMKFNRNFSSGIKMQKYWPIKEVMLHDEQNVEQNGEEAKSKFGGIAEDWLPVVWNQTNVCD